MRVLRRYSPMTKTMGDLSYFLKAIIEMKPWEYDYSVLSIPWRDVKPELEREGRKVRWGVLRDDGMFLVTHERVVLQAMIIMVE